MRKEGWDPICKKELSIAHVLRDHVVLIQPSNRQYDDIHGLRNGLTMAIILKHGMGQLVTTQGFRLHTGLGLVYLPQDKVRRALASLDSAMRGELTLADYQSLLGLLQSMLFVMAMRKAATYGLYRPFAAQVMVNPDELLRATPLIQAKLRLWRDKIAQCPGVPFTAAVPGMERHHEQLVEGAPVVFYLRSDACTSSLSHDDGSPPGLGGVLGGSYWSYLLDESERCLPIAVLEAAAWYGVVAAFAAVIPPDALVLGEVDALATVDTLTDDAASSPLMQHFHDELLRLPAFKRIEPQIIVAHVYGDANVMADAASRGKTDTLRRLAQQLGLALERVPPPPELPRLLSGLVTLQTANETAFHTEAQTDRGRHNLNMVGPPIAHENVWELLFPAMPPPRATRRPAADRRPASRWPRPRGAL